MTEDNRKACERELAELKERVARLEGRPVATWSAPERAASRENAMRVKRLMLLLIDDARQEGRAG